VFPHAGTPVPITHSFFLERIVPLRRSESSYRESDEPGGVRTCR
jgi:hypothetical protein